MLEKTLSVKHLQLLAINSKIKHDKTNFFILFFVKLFQLLDNPTDLFDSHCHLNDKTYAVELDDVVTNAMDSGIKSLFDMSVDLDSVKRSLEISKKFKEVKSFIGLDPDVFIPGSEVFLGLDKKDIWFEEIEIFLQKLINENSSNIKGIGETGMDFYWIEKDDSLSEGEKRLSKQLQEKLFRVHLKLAKKNNVPLSIHTRAAEYECLNIIKNYNAVGIFHSFTGPVEVALEAIKFGWGIGINGIITFKNAEEMRVKMREIFRGIGITATKTMNPCDFYKKGIYFETDSPYLSPQGKRGERNEPANIKEIFEVVKSLV